MAATQNTFTYYIYPADSKFTATIIDSDKVEYNYTHEDCTTGTYNNKTCLKLETTVGGTYLTLKINTPFCPNTFFVAGSYRATDNYVDLSYFNNEEYIITDRLYAYGSPNNEFETIYITTDDIKNNYINNWYTKNGKDITNCVYDPSGKLVEAGVEMCFENPITSQTQNRNTPHKLWITNGNMGGGFDVLLNGTKITSIGSGDTLPGESYACTAGVCDFYYPIYNGDVVTLNNTKTSGSWYTVTQNDENSENVVITSSSGIYDEYSEYNYNITGNLSIDVYSSYHCCVLGDCNITKSDGSVISADSVKINDKLMGYDVKNAKFCEVSVLSVIKKQRNELVTITLDTGTILKCTPDHPIYTDHGWVCYDPTTSVYRKSIPELLQLTEGMSVLTADNKFIKITKLDYAILPDFISTYTFNTTPGIDTFIAETCVVHNACEPL